MSASGRMGRNPFGQKAPAKPEARPQPAVEANAPQDELDEADSTPRGLIAKAFVKAVIELPADLFVLGVKTRAFFESWLE